MNETLRFLRPEWFYAAAVFLLLPFLLRLRHRAGGSWRAVCDWDLLQNQIIPARIRRLILPVALLGIGWLIALLALAGPAFEKLPQPVVKKGADTVFATDISLFMNVGDIQPSRMQRATFKISDILKKLQDGQNALILYDNEEFTAAPLTSDAQVIENILPTIEAGMMGGQAPKPAKALLKAAEMFKSANVRHGTVVLLGAYVDEADLGEAVAAAQALKNQGHRLFIIGVGDTKGAPVVLPDGSFFSIGGKPVLSGVSENAFETLARAGGGSYKRLSADDSDFADVLKEKENAVAPDWDGLLKDKKADVYKDVGYMLTWVLLVLTAFCFRRGWLAVIAVCIFTASPSQAFSLKDLFIRPEVAAAREIYQGNQAAPETFEDPSWHGAAQYKAGNYEAAVETLQQRDGERDRYNLGNALAHAGKYQEAIDAYADVLKTNPDHEDAAFNKKYLEEKLKQQQGGERRQNQNQNQNQQQDGERQQNQNQNAAQNQQNQPQNQNNANDFQPQNASGKKKSGQGEKQEKSEGREERQSNQPEERDGKQSSENKREQSENPQNKQESQENQSSNGKKRSEDWMDVVEDDPAGLLRARIQQKLIQKQQNYQRRRRGQ